MIRQAFVAAVIALVSGCTSTPIDKPRPDGSKETGTATSFIGIPCWTSSHITPSPADLVAQAKAEARALAAKAPGEREKKIFWAWLGGGALCLLLAIGLLFGAWVTESWKRFATGSTVFLIASVALFGLAAAAKWFIALPFVAAGVAAVWITSYVLRHHKLSRKPATPVKT